jgi:hypothetical protein
MAALETPEVQPCAAEQHYRASQVSAIIAAMLTLLSGRFSL